jgi:hypothetical protein
VVEAKVELVVKVVDEVVVAVIVGRNCKGKYECIMIFNVMFHTRRNTQ